MGKFLVNGEYLGKRLMGYYIYHSDTKEFIGYTEKQVKQALKSGEVIYGFVLQGDELVLDEKGFHTTNMMMKTGMNTLKPLKDLKYPINNLYVLVKQIKGNESNIYEVVNSLYGRVEITEGMLRTYIEIGILSGGAYLDNKGKIVICSGVEVEENKMKKEENKTK